MRDHVLLYVNGRRQQVFGSDAFLSLSDYLRLKLGLCGTKIVCSEGDCGSCTVLLGRPQGEKLHYLSVDSCIHWMFQLDGTHVVTVEGLQGSESDSGRLTSVQQAMVDCHGSQCGFCTPGFVMAMTGCLENEIDPQSEVWRQELTGNLCRCTGYVPILEACRTLVTDSAERLNSIYDPAPLLADLHTSTSDSPRIESLENGRMRRYFGPTKLRALEVLREFPAAKIVAGATDVGVQLNKGTIDPTTFIDLNRVTDLSEVELSEDASGRVLIAGARANWTQILSVVADVVPEFAQIVAIFGSPQIRNVGTIGGNLINASPIADSLPFLFVAEAELELASVAGTRRVPITKFYQGYKKFDLAPGEILVRVYVPLPDQEVQLRLTKVSRRRDLDIATFTAAIWLRLRDESISEARIAYGAVGPTVIRAFRTEEYLCGKPFSEETMNQAGNVAVGEVTPISDVRGSAEYRLQLVRNVLRKFYLEHSLVDA